MRSSILATTALLALGIIAAPASESRNALVERTTAGSCMTRQDAEKVATNFKDFISLPFDKSLAEASMASDFHDYSDSVTELMNAGCQGPHTLGAATFTCRDEFIKSQGGQPPIPFKILNLWNTCSEVIVRWRSSIPGKVQPEQEVTGILVIETEPNTQGGTDQPFLMKTVFSEFNSGAWLYDVGTFTPSCDAAAGNSTVHRRSVGGPRLF